MSEDTSQPVLRYSISPSANMIPWDEDPETGVPGIYRELVFLLLAESNIAGESTLLPQNRVQEALQKGQIDFDFINPDWFPNGDAGSMFVTSVPVHNFVEWFVTLPENTASFNSRDKVYGNAVGTITGFHYFDEDKFTRVDFDSQSAIIGGLKRGRIDVAILEEMTALYWSDKTSIKIAMSAVYSNGEIVLRLHKDKAHLLPFLNAAILRLQKKGKIRKILQEYRTLYRFK